VELSSKEAKIKSVQSRLQDVDEREERLDRRLEELEKSRKDFYEVEVASITRRHAEEVRIAHMATSCADIDTDTDTASYKCPRQLY